MYQITYKYGNTLKRAYVCADTLNDAKKILLGQYLVGAIEIVDVSATNCGLVVYPDGRF